MLINYDSIFTENDGSRGVLDDFLSHGNPTHKDKVDSSGNQELGFGRKFHTPELLNDIATLTATELRNIYPRTYKCWDNMKQRRHKGATIHPEFEEFKDFLTHVGPCEKKTYTLDRLNNDDLEYAPGKVAWRDKHAQNSNKGNNVYLTHDDGRVFTVAQWAKVTKQKPSTLYKRRENGWTDMEIITGTKSGEESFAVAHPWPYGKHDLWEQSYREAVLEKGFKVSRLHYLRNFSKREFTTLKRKKEHINLVIQRKHGFDDYESQGAFELYLADNSICLTEFENTPLLELEKLLHDVSEMLGKWEKCYIQSHNMFEYHEKRKKLMESQSSYLSKQEVEDYLHSTFPKPEFTIHLPPKTVGGTLK